MCGDIFLFSDSVGATSLSTAQCRDNPSATMWSSSATRSRMTRRLYLWIGIFHRCTFGFVSSLRNRRLWLTICRMKWIPLIWWSHFCNAKYIAYAAFPIEVQRTCTLSRYLLSSPLGCSTVVSLQQAIVNIDRLRCHRQRRQSVLSCPLDHEVSWRSLLIDVEIYWGGYDGCYRPNDVATHLNRSKPEAVHLRIFREIVFSLTGEDLIKVLNKLCDDNSSCEDVIDVYFNHSAK